MRKFLVFGLLGFVFGVALNAQAVTALASGEAQGKSVTADKPGVITVSLENVKLADAIREIAQRSGRKVTFAPTLVPSRRISYSAAGVSAETALSAVLSGTGIKVERVANGSLVLVKADNDGKTKGQGIIAGKVTDAKSGKAISGANVSAGNDTRGVVTDADGTYRLLVTPAGTQTVTVRLVGYAKQTRSVTVGENATVTVDFKLEPSASVLNDVVVTGTIIATELKAVPNAISVITAKQIEERGITRIDQLFRGDIPGLFSLNLGSNTPLDEVVMFSRGPTALLGGPLGSAGINNSIGALTSSIKTYIDGVEMADSRYISQIDPSSIERIEILTGPQASTIYGSNALNGVMQIFTKRGMGNKPQLTLNLSSGFIENNFSNAVAPNYVTDMAVTGVEGRLSYNAGGSWNYQGSWTPGKQTQRFSGHGGGRMETGKFTADFSARQGLTRNKQNGDLLHFQTNLRATGVLARLATSGQPEPRTQTLNGRTLGLSLSYRPFVWWSHEVVLGSDAAATENMKTAPGFSSLGSDTTLTIESAVMSRRSERYSSTVQVPIASMAKLNVTLGGDHWRTAGSSWSANPLLLTGSITNINFLTRDKPSKK